MNILSLIAALHDAIMVACSLTLSLYIRLNEEQFALIAPHLPIMTFTLTGISVCIFSSLHLYGGMWRFASMRDMITIVKGVTLSILVFAVAMFFLTRLEALPRSVLFINWLLLMVMLAAPRFAYRAFKDRSLFWEMTLEERIKIPVLLVGATSLAEQFIQDMARNPRTDYHIIGILDNDQQRHHRSLQRARIYGSINMFPEILTQLERKHKRPKKILIADPYLSGEDVQQLLEFADRFALPVARIPRLSDFQQHFDAHTQIQPIALEDLLGRPQVALDRAAMRLLVANKHIMVTGAGGSIGSELVRQILSYGPASICLLEACEYHLYQIHKTAAALTENVKIIARLGDVRDRACIHNAFIQQKPDILFHAAAIKHVPIAEDNPEEAALTNAIGTKNIADACITHDVDMMVLISTDKAVNPSNVMGATKKLAECYCQALGRQQDRTRFVTVRFGNVLGSTGSVVPLFTQQIQQGGPVTVTHPEMTRYFMTIREAVELVLQSAAIGGQMHDKREHIFVLDMGKPMNITQLAQQMIRLAGHTSAEIPIEYTGLRPGEKLHEELFHIDEHQEKTSHPSIELARPRSYDYSELSKAFDELQTACLARQHNEVILLLKRLVPEFHPLSQVA